MALSFMKKCKKTDVLVPLGRGQGYELTAIGKKYPSDLDYFVHFAAATPPNYEGEYVRVNASGTAYLLNRLKVDCPTLKRFVYISTGGVYGYGRKSFNETDNTSPHDDYSKSKEAGENFSWLAKWSFPVSIIRPFFPYTWQDDDKRLIGRLIKKIKTGQLVLLNKYSEPKINPIHLNDLTTIIYRAMNRKDGSYSVYNAAGPTTLNIRQLANKIGLRVEKCPRFYQTDTDIGGNMVADITQIKETFGLKLKKFG